MIQYIQKETALALLVAGLLKNPDPSRNERIRARLKYVLDEIPDGYCVDVGLIKLTIGMDLFDELSRAHIVK